MKFIISVILVIASLFLVGYFIRFCAGVSKIPLSYHKVEYKKSIENAISVESVDSRFVQHVSYGGAGGLGAVEIKVATAKEFLSLIPKNEKIYTATIQDNSYFVTKKYGAFLKDTTGFVFYTEEYSFENAVVDKIDNTGVTFVDDNDRVGAHGKIFGGILLLLIWFVFAGTVIGSYLDS
jgi:hypothetical protein